MRLSLNFTVLLATLLVLVSDNALAHPVKRAPATVTLPIRSLHAQKRSGVHPLILFQQQVNRAQKRHALMAGVAAPTDLELRQNLEKRLYILGDGAAPLTSAPTKRLYKSPAVDATIAKFRKGTREVEERDLIDDLIGALTDSLDGSSDGSSGGFDPFGSGDGSDPFGLGGGSDPFGSGGGSDPFGTGDGSDPFGTGDGSDPFGTGDGSDPSGTGDGSDPFGTGDGSDPFGTGSGSDPFGTGDGSDPSGTSGGSDPSGTGGGSDPLSGGDTNSTTPDSNSAGGSGGSGGFSPVALGGLNNGGLTNANDPTAANSLGLDVEGDDVGYVAAIKIGTPPRDFIVLMDSGSADFWVGGEQCQSQGGGDCGNHTFLGPKSSSSFKDEGKPFQVTYGSGQVAGNIIQDDVSIAGLALPGHTFGVASQESVDFSGPQTPFDGLMGLAQSTLSNQGVPTPVEALAKAGLIGEAIMSYKISRFQDGKNDGEVTFGGLDTTKFDQSTLVTIPNVNQQGFWEAPVSFKVNGQDLGLTGRTAILDTGTTLIIAPEADAAAIHKQIPGARSDGQGNFIVPCTGTPEVALTFGGADFVIDPRDLLFAPVDPNNLTGDCQSAIASGTIGGPQEWLVGDTFLKNAYFSTDVGKNTVSLAKLV